MASRSLYMIGNAHIDPVWLWRWQEGLREIGATFRSALDRMNEYADFVFTCSSAAFYEWVEESDPAMFAEIRRRVAEGRWKIVGGWWVQPDCNLPCGESFVRQGLLGQRYFERAFGVRARVGYNVDSFGHHAMLPQLLSKMGLTRYVFMRPGDHEMKLPARVFRWRAPDGSEVIAYRVPFTYTTSGGEIDDHIGRTLELLEPQTPALMCFYGVGNHGGGPTRANIESILHRRADSADTDILFASPDEFFDRVEGEGWALECVAEELQHHARGCYSAHSEVKRLNRAAEHRLLAAERFGALASVITPALAPIPLNEAWKSLLFNQFHDILAGSAIESAYDDAREQYGAVLATAARSINRSLQAVAREVDTLTEDQVQPLLVFNPNPHRVKQTVELEYLGPGQVGESGIGGSDRLVDDQARPVAFQLIQSAASDGVRTRLCFVAEVAGLGYRCYHVVRSADAEPVAAPIDPDERTNVIENELLRCEINRRTGCLERIVEKSTGAEIISAPGGRATVFRDSSDTWSHGVDRYDEAIGEFEDATLRLVESGPSRSVIRTTSSWKDSRLTQEFILAAGLPYIDVRVTLDWMQPHELLKLRFPVAASATEATFEIPFGSVIRPANGDEEPGQSWVDVTGRPITDSSGTGRPTLVGLSLATDSKSSFSVDGATISVTAVRSPIFAHHLPYQPAADGVYRFMDQGEQRFTLRLIPHLGDWRGARTARLAAELNDPLIATLATPHPGRLPSSLECASIEDDGIMLTALKLPEVGKGLILRCHEAHGIARATILRLPFVPVTIEAHFEPYEIKSFRLSQDYPEGYHEVDLLEE